MMTNASISFDRAAGFYDHTRGFPPGVGEQVAALALELIGSGARSLEVGIGTGRVAKPMLVMGAAVTGIDLSRGMMGRLRDVFPEAPLANADMAQLPFGDASFDAVLAVHVLHLVGDWRATVAEARRVLRPGGALLLGLNAHLPNANHALREKFNDLVAHERPRLRSWAVIDDEVLPALAASGATMLTRETPIWTMRVTPREEIAALRNRVWSSTWSLSDEAMQAALPELEAFAVETFGSLDAPVDVPERFQWRRFTW
jgi:ubiquinone/menaquinone biosynthesis C-methylase UbiE